MIALLTNAGHGYINATEGLGGSHNPNPLYPAQPSFGKNISIVLMTIRLA